ncbi:hypothetical protein DUNSADRAFT_13336 [Dunaliella salina]|uniref:Uncharacterized protein n=1 Tax=Dunaliella salina TaxID=3046 RepID=A0ABQ7G9P2_DUNSA|nr:hypothetical protein DUNSADRAFT_13336 [Dunaliella salina]|eukprot:KAF5831280.1 hypothetical protein DUNSADRAFT_13336 [Dunaliella salina]
MNVASRMETTAITNTLEMSEHAYQQLRRERLAMLPEAAKGQSVGAGGCGTFPDMHGQGKSSCSMVRGSSAPPSLLASKQDERGAALTEQGCSMGSSMCVQKSKSLFSREQLQPQQQGQRRPCQEEEKQQHCLCEQTGAQEKGGQNKPQKPESLVGGSAPLSQGAVTSFYTAAPAEQSSRVQQPGSVDLGPAHPGNWLERKLDVKGKGIMKAYTYIGQK